MQSKLFVEDEEDGTVENGLEAARQPPGLRGQENLIMRAIHNGNLIVSMDQKVCKVA